MQHCFSHKIQETHLMHQVKPSQVAERLTIYELQQLKKLVVSWWGEDTYCIQVFVCCTGPTTSKADLHPCWLQVNKGWSRVIHLVAPHTTIHHSSLHVSCFITFLCQCRIIVLTGAISGKYSSRRCHKSESPGRRVNIVTSVLLAQDIKSLESK